MIRETGQAKINLYLHVGGVRSDGLHDLASLFVFTEEGDVVTASPADDLTLKIDGPFSSALQQYPLVDNLVLKAAHALRDAAGVSAGAALHLKKNLPIAAGIGGGSADAAAALRALQKLWGVEVADEALVALAFSLGADVPACLSGAPVLVSGAGEIMAPAPALPPLWVCLVNSGVDMPTGPVFRAFDTANPAPSTPSHPKVVLKSARDAALMLEATRNDLEAAAISIAPSPIKDALSFLKASEGALGARMSGSGATCFAVFAEESEARRAATAASEKNSWWAMASRLASG